MGLLPPVTFTQSDCVIKFLPCANTLTHSANIPVTFPMALVKIQTVLTKHGRAGPSDLRPCLRCTPV